MAQKILALDLGQSSIGWVLRNTDFEGEQQYSKYGVFNFNKGVGEEKNNEYSLAAERTKYRSARRLNQSRKYKLWNTLKKLKAKDFCPIQEQALTEWTTYNKKLGLKRKYPTWDKKLENWIKLDFNGDNKPDFESPYQLRKYIAENRLDFQIPSNRYMLGRALYHIAQHRAFKSSKKVKLEEEQNDITDVGAEKKKKVSLIKEFEKIGIPFNENKTIGQLLAEAELFFKQRGYGRIRNELHPHVTRKMLQQEVEQIFKYQFGDNWLDKFKEIFEVEKISKCSIFWQRPLRSQKSAVGKCTLEKNKYRCPVSHPQFEIFRAWSFINNLRYKNAHDADFKELGLELKNKLYQEEFIKAGDFTVSVIRKWLIKELREKNIYLNYSDKTNVSGSPTIYYLINILGKEWETKQIPHSPIERIKKSNYSVKYVSQKNYYDYEDIWHVAFQLDDEEEVEEIARKKFNFNDEQVEQYLRMFNKMPVDYARLSLKAIRNINYFLKKGLIYTDAVLLAKIPDILGHEIYNQENEVLIINSLQDIIQQNRIRKNILNITNNLISEYKVNHFHERDYNYILQEDDISRIEKECKNFYGTSKWEKLSEEERKEVIDAVRNEFQSFFFDKKREYKKLPKLIDDLKQFLKDNFDFLDDKKLNSLYHPSAVDIYPKLTDKDKAADGKLYLQSPKTGSWKNPMALRVLQELRQLINYLIKTEQIDEETKIVIEIPRELNDANKRKAYEIWQKRKEEENKQFAIAIAELVKHQKGIKANENNDSDIDKFRIWYEQCFDEITREFTEKGPNELKLEKKKNKKGEETEEDITTWSENKFENISSSLWFKIQKAKDDILTKYRLWNEQNAICIYTGNIISLSVLFNEDTIDIEHTLPYSRSLDNSLENKTVCFKEYNRNEKKNSLPAECHNYDEILERIKPWQEKIAGIEKHLKYWKNESKKATTPVRKNQCIVEKHLWTWELQYWKNKVERFFMKDITTGFVNAQLVETQIISKYAFHYLKTLFENVQVVKGSITAEFARILGVRDKFNPKIRDKHTHHTIDAFVLSLVPDSGRLKSILEKNAEIEELIKLNEFASHDERSHNLSRIETLNRELQQLLIESRIPINSLHKIIQKIKNTTIALTPTREKIFATAKKKIRKGKFKGKYATGDVVRGQLHKESFYGKIKLVKRDEAGKPMRNEMGEWVWLTNEKGEHQFSFVKRINLNEVIIGKKDQKKAIENFINDIVDPFIKKLFINKILKSESSKILEEFKKHIKKGGLLYNHPKTGKTIRIRHVRCFQKPTDLLEIKEQSHKSKHDYKNVYYADNAENIYYALYEDEKGNRAFEMLNLFDAVKIKQNNAVRKPEDFFEPVKEIEIDRGKNKTQAKLKAVFYINQKVILYKESIDELRELDLKTLTSRIFTIKGFEKDGRILFKHHLEARRDNILSKESKIDFDKIAPLLRLSKDNFNFAIEGRNFEITPDGNIIWRF